MPSTAAVRRTYAGMITGSPQSVGWRGLRGGADGVAEPERGQGLAPGPGQQIP